MSRLNYPALRNEEKSECLNRTGYTVCKELLELVTP